MQLCPFIASRCQLSTHLLIWARTAHRRQPRTCICEYSP